MSELRQAVLGIVMEKGYRRLAEPVQLASGALSRDYVDAKRALARGRDLSLACEALLEAVRAEGVAFDAVGGLTLGADQFAHVLAVLSDTSWFVVRKQAKGHGSGRRVEGAELGPGVSALLVDDVVSTGGSILDALKAVRATGATVVGAAALVDRGAVAGERLAAEGVPFLSLLTYADLGIEPVSAELSAEGR